MMNEKNIQTSASWWSIVLSAATNTYIEYISSFSCEQSELITFTNSMNNKRTNDDI